MLRLQWTLLAAVLCSAAHAEIYRWVDEEGRAQFSDRWNPDAEKVRKPSPSPTPKSAPTATVAAKAAPGPALAPPPLPAPASSDELFLGPYASLEILAPALNETLTVGSEGIGISLMVDPPLIAGQQMTMLLDETALPIEKGATQFKLTGTSLGSHRLQIRVTGGDGRVVAQSAPISFHVQRPKQPGELR